MYLIGEFTDVSPRSFLLCQTREQLRSLWDDSMRSMNSLSLTPGQGLETQDFIYYRAKWPWPLKDRDYTLTRRHVEVIFQFGSIKHWCI